MKNTSYIRTYISNKKYIVKMYNIFLYCIKDLYQENVTK